MDSPVEREEYRSRHLRGNVSERFQKSIQVLSDLGSAANSTLRAAKTPRSAHASYNPQYVKNAEFNISAFLQNADLETSTLDSSAFFQELGASNGSSTNLAFTSADETCFMKDGTIVINPDYTMTTASYLEEANPGKSAAQEIYDNFLDALETHSSENQIFDLLKAYTDICLDSVAKLKALLVKLPVGQQKFTRTSSLKTFLQIEANTWEIIRSLYSDRLFEESNHEDLAHASGGGKLSARQVVEQLYSRDSSVRQSQLVVNWLEAIAQQELEDFAQDRFEYFTDKCIAWEDTLNTLKQGSRSGRLDSGRPLVDELDPDAPIRQGKPLTDLDKDDEAMFLKYLFHYIRTGQIDKAERLCEHCGQYWRAATLEGWKLHHDPNYAGLKNGDKPNPVEGNKNRHIWKAACWEMSEQEVFNPYERAIYATLSGHLKAILPVCKSWGDYLWAYFRVMIEAKVEAELQSKFILAHGSTELSMEHEQSLTQEAIFQELGASTVGSIQKESRLPFPVIQKYIILDDIEGLVEEMHELAQTCANTMPHLIRFVAHLVLFLRSYGRSAKEELCISILEKYVHFLVNERKIKLVAAYTAALPQSHQVAAYASFLEGISKAEERQVCLQLAEKAGLDVPIITKTVVENIRTKPDSLLSEQAAYDLQASTTQEDQEKINAIDWLIFSPAQRSEAMRQANALIRVFLACGKLGAAQAVFTKIPPDSIDLVLRKWRGKAGHLEISAADNNITREYLCIQSYLQAHDAFNDWFEHLHHYKPECPELRPHATFSERVAYEHKQKQYEADLDRWRHTLDLQTKTTIGRMYNILLFIDGGWLMDQHEEDPVDEQRKLQMQRLRELCLPQTTFFIHSILHATGQYRECFQLANVIASEQHKLYKVFNKHELQRFLGKLRESSIALLDAKLDPFGYPDNRTTSKA